jgi:hypothetical protein
MTAALIFKFLYLWIQTSRLPDVQPEFITPAVLAALHVETEDAPSELLISIAWSESRLDPTVRTGNVCGILQVNPTDIGQPRSDCTIWSNNVEAGMHAGVIELQMLRADHRAQTLQRALLYRACGNAAFNGTCHKTQWPTWVLDRAQCLRTFTWHVDARGYCVRNSSQHPAW